MWLVIVYYGPRENRRLARRRSPYAKEREEALPGVRLHVARTAALGGRLAAARRAAGLTQAEAATALGVPRANLAMWERGYHDVTYSHLVRLARLYRLDAAALFGDDLAPNADTSDKATGDARDDHA